VDANHAVLARVTENGGAIVEASHPHAPDSTSEGATFRDPAGSLMGLYQEAKPQHSGTEGTATGHSMKWYNYLACFFAGVFLVHFIPHLIHGMSFTNLLGALVSLVVGGLLLWAGKLALPLKSVSHN
jgi:hypothetical protein